MSVPYTLPGVWPQLSPGRFASGFRAQSPAGCRLALLGLPDDLGVKLNSGRPGAKAGPTAFRAALAGFGVPWDGLAKRGLDVPVYDAGDVTPAPGADEAALFETHRRVEGAVSYLRELGLVTVCIGGGHDLSLPTLTAVARHAGRALGGINVDAHLDVRERIGSGMPFRRLIDGGYVDPRHFVELGLGRFVNDRSDLEWLTGLGATLIHAQTILERRLGVPGLRAALATACAGAHAFLSIDLDVLDQSIAPGVSAPNPLGLALRDVAELAEAAGKRPEIGHFDLMELNPSYDVDGRTARTAALLFLHFVAGFVARE